MRHGVPALLGLTALLLLGGCAAPLPPPPPPRAAAPRPPEGGATVLLLGPVPAAEEGPGDFTLRARGTDLRDALRALFAAAPSNLVLDPEVQGKVTLDLKATSPAAALLELLESQDLTVRAEGRAVRIGARETRIFDLGYVNATNQPYALSTTQNGSGGSGRSVGSTNGPTQGGRDEDQELWKNVTQQLQTLISDDGHLVVNPIAGKILVTDRPGRLDVIEEYLQEVEASLRRQVLIRAEILEVTLDRRFEVGVDYALFPDFLRLKEQGLLPGGAVLAQQGHTNLQASLTFGILKQGDFGALVSALQRQGQVRILQSPRVATLNNQPATLAVVRRLPVIEREIIDGTTVARTQFDIRYEDVGILVTVTPQISPDGRIILRVDPKVSEQIGTVTTPDGLQTEPIIAERSASTTLTVMDGEPVLIAGLRGVRKREVVRGIPVLADLPLLGTLFRRLEQETVHTETLIYLVPSIVDTDGMRRAVERGLMRIEKAKVPFRFGPLAFDRTPEDGADFGRLGRRARPQGGGEGAAAVREKVDALTARGLAAYFRDVGYRRYLRGDLVGARRALRYSVAVHPLDGSACRLLGVLAVERGRFRAARRYLRLALAADAENPWVLNNLGVMALCEGAFTTAERYLRRAARGLPEEPAVQNNLAVALMSQGRLGAAYRLFTGILARHPEFPEARRNLARLEQDAREGVALPLAERPPGGGRPPPRGPGVRRG